ncbi:MAG: dienelactone hydrolase family protein [Proteobacteria bacterium]|nr:dienelactone hydrolase family protein [Pseudomonadota bacterium]
MNRFFPILLAAGLFASACSFGPPAPPAAIENFMSVIDPGGPGPHPAAILVPGCDGVGPHVAFAADRLAREGFVVLTLDFPGAYRLDGTCTQAQTAGIAADVVRAARETRRHANVDPAKIHLVGWAEGGAGIMAALGDPEHAAGVGARSAAAFYPACERLDAWRTSVPFLMLLADGDTQTPPKVCYELTEKSEGADKVLAIRYGGVGHRFDVPDAAGRSFWRPWRGGQVNFSEAVRDAALHDLSIFFVEPPRR